MFGSVLRVSRHLAFIVSSTPSTQITRKVSFRSAAYHQNFGWKTHASRFDFVLHTLLKVQNCSLKKLNTAFGFNILSCARMSSFPFCAEYDKRGQAKCKKCKEKCEKGELRIGKIVTNPFSESGGDMKQWHHVNCIFETFKRARATTKKIEDPVDDIEGWENLEEDDQKKIRALIDDLQNEIANKKTTPKKQTPQKKTPSKAGQQQFGKKAAGTPDKPTAGVSRVPSAVRNDPGMDPMHKDNSFREFRRLCANVAEESSYTGKTNIVATFLKNGANKDGFQGDLRLWVKLLLPGVIKRVYNLQSKQLIKLFSQLFNTNQEEMLEDLEQGDIAETVRNFFEQSAMLPPVKKATLSIQDVDQFLEELTGMTREEEQSYVLKKIAKRCTANDLKMVIRLIKGDLRINAGAKHILDAVHNEAYEAFQTTRNIDAVMDQIILSKTTGETLKMKAQVMTPVLPMLAEACKSVDYAFKKCPSGVMYSEIKYDGERVQVHKKDGKFLYYSRSLKPVMPHKVSHFKEYIPKAFPYGKDLILDAEVLMMDTKSGNPLPFGTLGVHKKSEFQDATVCLFVFDCLHYNGEDLMDKPIADRKKILEENMVEIKNHIMLSEMKKIKRKEDLRDMINRVLKQGLEGLVLKDVNSVYEPGKRHWLKVKKDYLNDGAMADTADLVVLGAWYGTGKKGGMMSVFLMGCYDARIKKWCTVTKVHTGHDDATLARLQTELDMVKISQDSERVPAWLKCTKTMIPDFVAADPKKSPVWEITGAEFTRHQIHTADGISIRFPRVTRERSDKTWEQATDLAYLQELYKKSRECSDLEALTSERTDDDDDNGKKSGDSGSSTPIKVQASSPKVSNVSAAFASPKTLSPDKAKGREKIQRTLSAFVKMDRTKPENEDEIKKEKMEHSGTVLGKRHSDENRDRQPNKKLNKYGASESETHQTLNELPSAGLRHPTKNPLPDIFIGIQVGIPDTVPKVADMKRYIIAYGGDVLPDYQASEATHLVVDKEDKWPSSWRGRRISPEWIWDSIKLQRLQSSRIYSV